MLFILEFSDRFWDINFLMFVYGVFVYGSKEKHSHTFEIIFSFSLKYLLNKGDSELFYTLSPRHVRLLTNQFMYATSKYRFK